MSPVREAQVGKRRLAREMAIQMLYQSEMGGSSAGEVIAGFDLTEALRDAQGDPETHRNTVREAFEYAKMLVQGVIGERGAIDERIQQQADNWRLERMPPVDRNILRLAAYELFFEPETPQLVVVDEAIELAKRFGSEQSGRFINGLLDGLLRSHQLLPTSGRKA